MVGPWDPECELRLKQVLYRYMEELEATKAALYLTGASGNFQLVTSYGFGRRDSLAAEIKAGHPLYDWVRRHRTVPTFLNSSVENPDLQPVLEGSGSSKILTVPIVLTDRMVGFVDARDKARKQPYSSADVAVARPIAAAIETLLKEVGYSLSSPGQPVSGSAGTAASTVTPPAAAPEPPANVLSRWVIEQFVAFLRTVAQLPGVTAVAFTITDGRSTRTLVLRTVPFEDKQKEALITTHVQRLESLGVKLPGPSSWGWEEQESGGTSTRAEEVRTVVLLSSSPTWLLLSVLTPASVVTGETVLQAASEYFSVSRSLRNYRRATRNLARTLLEPGETPYPHLRQHCQAVSEISQRMAAGMQLGEDDEELFTIGGYLHDVGMRELDYTRTYRMERPGDAEQRLYQRHTVVGARILENAEYPGELARVIRHHHERWDGGGYPGKLTGRNIPIGSRAIHLAEVFDVLTSPSSYRRPMSKEAALELIRSESGKQFDPELVPVLEEAVRQ